MKRTIFSSICTSHLDKPCVIVPDGNISFAIMGVTLTFPFVGPQVTYRQFRDEIERVSILLAKAGLSKGKHNISSLSKVVMCLQERMYL